MSEVNIQAQDKENEFDTLDTEPSSNLDINQDILQNPDPPVPSFSKDEFIAYANQAYCREGYEFVRMEDAEEEIMFKIKDGKLMTVDSHGIDQEHPAYSSDDPQLVNTIVSKLLTEGYYDILDDPDKLKSPTIKQEKTQNIVAHDQGIRMVTRYVYSGGVVTMFMANEVRKEAKEFVDESYDIGDYDLVTDFQNNFTEQKPAGIEILENANNQKLGSFTGNNEAQALINISNETSINKTKPVVKVSPWISIFARRPVSVKPELKQGPWINILSTEPRAALKTTGSLTRDDEKRSVALLDKHEILAPAPVNLSTIKVNAKTEKSLAKSVKKPRNLAKTGIKLSADTEKAKPAKLQKVDSFIQIPNLVIKKHFMPKTEILPQSRPETITELNRILPAEPFALPRKALTKGHLQPKHGRIFFEKFITESTIKTKQSTIENRPVSVARQTTPKISLKPRTYKASPEPEVVTNNYKNPGSNNFPTMSEPKTPNLDATLSEPVSPALTKLEKNRNLEIIQIPKNSEPAGQIKTELPTANKTRIHEINTEVTEKDHTSISSVKAYSNETEKIELSKNAATNNLAGEIPAIQALYQLPEYMEELKPDNVKEKITTNASLEVYEPPAVEAIAERADYGAKTQSRYGPKTRAVKIQPKIINFPAIQKHVSSHVKPLNEPAKHIVEKEFKDAQISIMQEVKSAIPLTISTARNQRVYNFEKLSMPESLLKPEFPRKLEILSNYRPSPESSSSGISITSESLKQTRQDSYKKPRRESLFALEKPALRTFSSFGRSSAMASLVQNNDLGFAINSGISLVNLA